MIGLIRVVSVLNDEQLSSHARAIRHIVGDQIISRAIPNQPDGIHNEQTFAMAVPKIVELGRQFEDEGAQLVIISCAADPGLEELRNALQIPVVGAGSAGAALALAAGGRVGVLGITWEVPQAVTSVLGDRLVADSVPEGVNSTIDLMRPDAYVRALEATDALVNAGAESILFACTGLTTIGLAADVVKRTGIPVVDAVMAAGSTSDLILHPAPPAD